MNDTKNYEKLKYSVSQIKKAGTVISKEETNTDNYLKSIDVLDNWRAVHALPLDNITNIINDVVKNYKDIYVVQRLKRLESIINKLKRKNNAGLYRMQDLGGCRVIVPKIKDVYSITSEIENAIKKFGHKIYNKNDYIDKPRKESGYRSIHLVVEYVDDVYTNHKIYIEIQIRTKLEHAWATAVEIVDTVTKQKLKTGGGNDDFREFFKLSSALFSIEEKTHIVDGVTKDKKTIVNQLNKIGTEIDVLEKLSAYRNVIRLTQSKIEIADYYLLKIDMKKGIMRVITFSKQNIFKATEAYQKLEKNRQESERVDVVLVAAESLDIIKECYPNYFLDTSVFLFEINKICMKYPYKSEISFEPKKGSINISKHFLIKTNSKHIKKGIETDGIGLPDSELSYCANQNVTNISSYLRFSPIKLDTNSIDSISNTKRTKINNTCIIITKNGGCYLLEKEDKFYTSNSTNIMIKCRKNTDIKMLYVLIAWFKSNICIWDMLFNHQKTSLCNLITIFNYYFPNLSTNEINYIYKRVIYILEREKQFLASFQSMDNEDSNTLIMIDSFNDSVSMELNKIEKMFINHYELDETIINTIRKDLNYRGYYTHL